MMEGNEKGMIRSPRGTVQQFPMVTLGGEALTTRWEKAESGCRNVCTQEFESTRPGKSELGVPNLHQCQF